MSAPKSGHKAQLDVAGATTAMSLEACTVIAGTSNENWRITDTTKNVWDWGVTFTVEAEDTAAYNTLATSEYRIKYLTGTVEIYNYTSGTGVPANITNVRVTGNYLPMFEAVEAESANVDLLSNMLMVSVLGNNGERRIQGRLDGSASYTDLRRPWTPIDSPTDLEEGIIQRVLDGAPTVVSLYPDRDAMQYAIRMAVNVEGSAMSLPGGDKFTNALSLTASTYTPAMSSQTLEVWDLLE